LDHGAFDMKGGCGSEEDIRKVGMCRRFL